MNQFFLTIILYENLNVLLQLGQSVLTIFFSSALHSVACLWYYFIETRMFKKLRQKIESTDSASPQDINISPSGKIDDSRRFNRGTNYSSNLKKTDSVSSLNSCDDMVRMQLHAMQQKHSLV